MIAASRAYIELTKPSITVFILMSAAVGYTFGASQPAEPVVLAGMLLGTGLLAAETAALNEWWESESDARMRRTAHRPIPSGRVSARNAALFGYGISLLGFVGLWVFTGRLSAGLGLFTFAAYLFMYTPLKSRSCLLQQSAQ